LANRRAAALQTQGLMLSVVAYLATALFLHFSYARFFWLLLALADSDVRLSECDDDAQDGDREPGLAPADDRDETAHSSETAHPSPLPQAEERS